MRKTSTWFHHPPKWLILLVLLAGVGLVLRVRPSQAQSKSSSANKVTKAGYTLAPGSSVDTSRWPVAQVDFSIERDDKTLFQSLATKDVEANLASGQPLPLRGENSLRQNNKLSVLFMLDRSGSMSQGGKLSAAQNSINAFIDKLGPNDNAAVASFNTAQFFDERGVAPTSDKTKLRNGVSAIDASGDTALYDSLDKAIDYAEKNGLKNVIFLSDGWDDLKTRVLTDDEKRQREENISRLSRDKGIRVFTVAIGTDDPGSTKDTAGAVDVASLRAIAEKTNGGTCKHVNPVALQQKGGNINDEMKDTLEAIRKESSYNYSVDVKFPANLPREDGELKLNFKVDNKVQLSAAYPYTWDAASGKPIFMPSRILDPIFIDPLTSALGLGQLFSIYLYLLLPLGLLSLAPLAYNRLETWRETKHLSKSIVEIRANSPLLGKQCPNEEGQFGRRYAFAAGDVVMICPNCSTPHHLMCWDFNKQQCMVQSCERPMQVPAKLLAKYGVEQSNAT